MDSTCDLVETRTGKRPSPTEWIAAASGFLASGTLQVINLLMSIQSDEVTGGSTAVEKDEAVRYISPVSRTHRAIVQSVPVQTGQPPANEDPHDQ